MNNWQRFLPGCDPVIHDPVCRQLLVSPIWPIFGHCHWQNSNGIQRKSGVSCRKRWSAVMNGLSRVEVPKRWKCWSAILPQFQCFFSRHGDEHLVCLNFFLCGAKAFGLVSWSSLSFPISACGRRWDWVFGGSPGWITIASDHMWLPWPWHIDQHRPSPSTSSGLWPDPWSVCNLALRRPGDQEGLRRPGDQEGRTLEVCHVMPCHYVTVEFIGSRWFGTLLNGCAQFMTGC